MRRTGTTMIGLTALLACGEPQPPTCEQLEDQSIHIGEEVTVTVHCLDPEGGSLSYTAESADETVATASLTSASSDPALPPPSVTVGAAGVGETVVTITVTNTQMLDHVISMTVEVPNRAPVLTDAISVPVLRLNDSPLRYDLSDHFADPDGHDMTFTAESLDPTVVSASVSGTRLTLTVLAIGESELTVLATDEYSDTVSYTTDMEVVNRPPEVVRPLEVPVLGPDNVFRVDLRQHFNDPDEEVLAYTAVSSDESVVSVVLTEPIVELVARSRGQATFTVTATDGSGASAHASVVVTVTVANRPPAVVKPIGVPALGVNESYDFDLGDHFVDPDMEMLTYTATSSNPSIVSVELDIGSRVRVTGRREGSVTLTATASDAAGATARAESTVKVRTEDSALFSDHFERDDGSWTNEEGGYEIGNGVLRVWAPDDNSGDPGRVGRNLRVDDTWKVETTVNNNDWSFVWVQRADKDSNETFIAYRVLASRRPWYTEEGDSANVEIQVYNNNVEHGHPWGGKPELQGYSPDVASDDPFVLSFEYAAGGTISVKINSEVVIVFNSPRLFKGGMKNLYLGALHRAEFDYVKLYGRGSR